MDLNVNTSRNQINVRPQQRSGASGEQFVQGFHRAMQVVRNELKDPIKTALIRVPEGYGSLPVDQKLTTLNQLVEQFSTQIDRDTPLSKNLLHVIHQEFRNVFAEYLQSSNLGDKKFVYGDQNARQTHLTKTHLESLQVFYQSNIEKLRDKGPLSSGIVKDLNRLKEQCQRKIEGLNEYESKFTAQRDKAFKVVAGQRKSETQSFRNLLNGISGSESLDEQMQTFLKNLNGEGAEPVSYHPVDRPYSKIQEALIQFYSAKEVFVTETLNTFDDVSNTLGKNDVVNQDKLNYEKQQRQRALEKELEVCQTNLLIIRDSRYINTLKQKFENPESNRALFDKIIKALRFSAGEPQDLGVENLAFIKVTEDVSVVHHIKPFRLSQNTGPSSNVGTRGIEESRPVRENLEDCDPNFHFRHPIHQVFPPTDPQENSDVQDEQNGSIQDQAVELDLPEPRTSPVDDVQAQDITPQTVRFEYEEPQLPVPNDMTYKKTFQIDQQGVFISRTIQTKGTDDFASAFRSTIVSLDDQDALKPGLIQYFNDNQANLNQIPLTDLIDLMRSLNSDFNVVDGRHQVLKSNLESVFLSALGNYMQLVKSDFDGLNKLQQAVGEILDLVRDIPRLCGSSEQGLVAQLKHFYQELENEKESLLSIDHFDEDVRLQEEALLDLRRGLRQQDHLALGPYVPSDGNAEVFHTMMNRFHSSHKEGVNELVENYVQVKQEAIQLAQRKLDLKVTALKDKYPSLASQIEEQYQEKKAYLSSEKQAYDLLIDQLKENRDLFFLMPEDDQTVHFFNHVLKESFGAAQSGYTPDFDTLLAMDQFNIRPDFRFKTNPLPFRSIEGIQKMDGVSSSPAIKPPRLILESIGRSTMLEWQWDGPKKGAEFYIYEIRRNVVGTGANRRIENQPVFRGKTNSDHWYEPTPLENGQRRLYQIAVVKNGKVSEGVWSNEVETSSYFKRKQTLPMKKRGLDWSENHGPTSVGGKIGRSYDPHFGLG